LLSSPLKTKRLLSERQEVILTDLQLLLEQLQKALEQLNPDVAPADSRALSNTLAHLSDLFLLVIAGEYNSGKSSFINALLGERILPEGVTPTTDRLNLLRYGPEPQVFSQSATVLERVYPSPVLRQLTIVDTPGTNAVLRQHEELTRDFIPHADLVLFVTSADRPFTESERLFLTLIAQWGKKIVLILNKIDILEAEELEQVLAFVQQNSMALLGHKPEIFPVSARLALRSRLQTQDPSQEEASRIKAVENYILETLDPEARLRLKLLSPLGVAQRLTTTYLKLIQQRLATLSEDFKTIDNIEQQLTLFRNDLITDAQLHLNEIDLLLQTLEQRGDHFFDSKIRLNKIQDLIHPERMRTAFQQEVVGDLPAQIEQRVQVLIDWMLEKNLRLWQNIVSYVQQTRVNQHPKGIIGKVEGTFDYNRASLLDSIGQTASQIVSSYDHEYEARILADDVQASLAATALTQMGAVGLGAAMVALFHTVWLDVTGVLAATLVALGGFYFIPAKRNQAKKAFHGRISELRKQLRQNTERQVEREAEQALTRIREALSPYTRFVRGQRTQFTDLQQTFKETEAQLQRLRREIEA